MGYLQWEKESDWTALASCYYSHAHHNIVLNVLFLVFEFHPGIWCGTLLDDVSIELWNKSLLPKPLKNLNWKYFSTIKTQQAKEVQCLKVTYFTLLYSYLQIMSSKMSWFFGLFVCLMLSVSLSTSSKFDELFQPSWAFDHFLHEGDLLKLKLDNSSGKYIISL